jgi:hypothetical protein
LEVAEKELKRLQVGIVILLPISEIWDEVLPNFPGGVFASIGIEGTSTLVSLKTAPSRSEKAPYRVGSAPPFRVHGQSRS